MTKAEKLRLCDTLLAVSSVAILLSAIQLEATGGSTALWVWLHAAIGALFFANVGWHLYLHFGWNSWVQRLRKQKSPATRLLAVLALLTFISTFVALFHYIGTRIHSVPGAVHGKIGFLFLLIAIGHTVKRIRFFKRKPSARG